VIDPKALLADLKGQVKALEADLRLYGVTDETTAAELEREWRAARDAQRIAATREMWLEDRVTQVAAAWVLGTVFVRFCEDNDLIEYPVIAGPGDRVAVARERQGEFFEESPELTDRDWIIEGFNALSVSPVAAGLFEWHNPMWSILPSHEAAKALLAFWREQDANAQIVHDFTDEAWNTRFLGDLYQDLSEYAKKTYALLQTPVFVEEFILKYTLDPAIAEFGLEPEPPYGHTGLPRRLRVIDPACGSGHFLLGTFQRLLAAWQDQSGDTDKWMLIARALESVHGVDKNPFAAAIARFRLMLAAMQAGDVKRLTTKVVFPINVAVGDSLLHGRGAPGIQTELELYGGHQTYTYRTEDVDDYIKSVDILGVGSYHVVVANPPYIIVQDKKENENYRKAYKSCSGKYALSVPFAERIFQLAIRGAQDGAGAGYAGQITSNSFMKREFGRKLIEEYFPNVDLTHVIDTSGAYIPGHGTPTVILLGRRRYARTESTIRAVLGVRGEPSQPMDPALGLVWQAIVGQIDRPGSDSEWVTVADLPRGNLAKFPWSLSGGGADSLLSDLNLHKTILQERIDGSIGFHVILGDDEVYISDSHPLSEWLRIGAQYRKFTTGDHVRDWSAGSSFALWPYTDTGVDLEVQKTPLYWPFRTCLRAGLTFGKTREQRNMAWHEHIMLSQARTNAAYLLAFACVATHNHFMLSHGQRLHNRHAPVIKLPDGASEEDYLALLGVLNSSTACFWLKQVSYPKGGDPVGDEGARVSAESWSDRYEFTGTKLEQFPLLSKLPLEFGRELDRLAKNLVGIEPSAVCAETVPVREGLDAARGEHERIWRRMIALQEELDWDVYRRYGLLDDNEAQELTATPDSVPELRLGERAFEILLARRVHAGEVKTQWFARHGSLPITEVPGDWPQEYRDVVARRIEIIERRRDIGLIERPECKRRWQSEPWEKKEQAALRDWLLDRCESRDLWYVMDHQGDKQPRPMTLNRLADRLRGNADVVSVARLFSGPDADLADVLKEIIADEHVPFLSKLRYNGTGLLKHYLWEQTWDQQREEDRTGQQLEIDVPPKYKKEDFLKTSYWHQRGKLDVRKERFISYPMASPDSDDSLLLGWAGWDYREQALSLITLIEERANTDGWDAEKLTPLLAGLLEVMPWVRQWYDEIDPAFGASPAYEYGTYLTSQREKYGLTEDNLRAWTPPVVRREGRRGGGA
jgi:hypothetical protein